MNKIFTLFLSVCVAGTSFAQWKPAKMQGTPISKTSPPAELYTLDLKQLRGQLSRTPEIGQGNGTEIQIPTLDGKLERFIVYSFPVVVKSLADRYQLGSYTGVGLDDPKKSIRFSVSPNDFQSMIIKDGKFEFIDAQDTDKSIYGVHAKTAKEGGNMGFVCSTEEGATKKAEIESLLQSGKHFPYSQNSTARIGDQKYRTLRLVISVTGEYTKYFNGVDGALAQINATMTRVNGVYEREIATHLILQDHPELIYDNADTDPYSDASAGAGGAWNLELQKTLTKVVGEANYDIGHLFGASGGGGNAGCIGCVCISPSIGADGIATSKQKGSAFTSPSDGNPQGDAFDIDYVAHEMGHQLGANHTFTHEIQGSPVQMEPGSGSTIMGYAGITGTTTDVQAHSDPYFHLLSIYQIQENLTKKTCDVEQNIANTAPTVADMADLTIPKATAFVLTGSATDAENDPLTYSWEEIDNTKTVINKNNLGQTTSGPSFRVLNPVNMPTRYFPKLESVMNGVLNNANNTWESVSYIPRITNFGLTARENNPANKAQQVGYNTQQITVGTDGPFRVSSVTVYRDLPTYPLIWDVVNTNKAPYNSPNVRIDYTKDNGATWTVLSASTPNDGSENFDFSGLADGTVIKVRVSSIGNVFYAVGTVSVKNSPTGSPDCAALTAPKNKAKNVVYNNAVLKWTAPTAGQTVDSFDIYLDTNPNPTTPIANTTLTSFTVNNLSPLTTYYWKVVPKNIVGVAQACSIFSFTSSDLLYCSAASESGAFENIASVKFSNLNKGSSSEAGYENFTSSVAKVELNKSYTFTATANSSYDKDQVIVWIDYNQDKDFDDAGETVFTSALQSSPYTASITIPATAKIGNTRMRVRLHDADEGANATPCGNSDYGQVEDYTVNIAKDSSLATVDSANDNEDIRLYPNPVSDVLNITKVSAKAKYSVFTMAGTKIASGIITDGQINVQAFPKGVYVISIDDNGKIFTSKFIKK